MNFKTLVEKKRGYSLVEVMVAITILMLAIAGPLTIAAKSLKSTQYAKNETIAYLLAQEGTEAFVAIRNEGIIRSILGSGNVWDWTNDADLAPCFTASGCNLEFRNRVLLDSADITSCSNLADCLMYHDPTISETMMRTPYHLAKNAGASSEPTIYTRVVRAEDVNSNEIKIVSEVTWNSNLFGGEESVSVVTHVFKLYDNI